MTGPKKTCADCGAVFELERDTPTSSQAWRTRVVDPATMQTVEVRNEVEVFFYCKGCRLPQPR